MSSLGQILAAAESFAAPAEPVGVMVAKVGQQHRIRVVVGGEVIAHVHAESREEAVQRALDELADATSNLRNLEATAAFVDACSWG